MPFLQAAKRKVDWRRTQAWYPLRMPWPSTFTLSSDEVQTPQPEKGMDSEATQEVKSLWGGGAGGKGKEGMGMESNSSSSSSGNRPGSRGLCCCCGGLD